MAITKPKFNIIIIPGASLLSVPWWPELHTMINESYSVKNCYMFPPTWTRLNLDPVKAAEGLANELGDNGHIAVAFNEEGHPVACGGVLPYRGANWINAAFKKSDADLANAQTGSEHIVDWETCCFCVHPSGRGHWLSHQVLEELVRFVREKGGTRLFTNYARDETGEFWPRLGFEVVPDAGGMLPKGFKRDLHDPEGLRADIHFEMGVKVL